MQKKGRAVWTACALVSITVSLLAGIAYHRLNEPNNDLLQIPDLEPPPAPAPIRSDTRKVNLNNEGVRALNRGEFKTAIENFEESLKMDPTYAVARSNLSIAYNNLGLHLKDKPNESIKMFHKAVYLQSNNQTSRSNLDAIISILGSDPKKFEDRVALADAAKNEHDWVGAIVEYRAALAIKNDADVHAKLADVYRDAGNQAKAAQEYQNARDIKETLTGGSAQSQLRSPIP